MLKMALFDCAINEKCCSVDGGRVSAVFFVPTPGNLPSKAKKCQCLGVSLGGGGEGGLVAGGID